MEQSVKAIFGLLLYFLLLTTIVTIGIAINTEFGFDDTVETSGGYTELEEFTAYSSSPRFIEFVDFENSNTNRHLGTRDLVNFGFITDEDSCLYYNGFTWEKRTFLTVPYGDPICKGELNLAYYDGSSNEPAETAFGYKVANKDVCDFAYMQTNQQIAESFGCTWYSSKPINDQKDLNVILESLKSISTLNIDFNIENTFFNFMINFLLIGFPAILLSIYLIVLGRQIVGWT